MIAIIDLFKKRSKPPILSVYQKPPKNIGGGRETETCDLLVPPLSDVLFLFSSPFCGVETSGFILNDSDRG